MNIQRQVKAYDSTRLRTFHTKKEIKEILSRVSQYAVTKMFDRSKLRHVLKKTGWDKTGYRQKIDQRTPKVEILQEFKRKVRIQERYIHTQIDQRYWYGEASVQSYSA